MKKLISLALIFVGLISTTLSAAEFETIIEDFKFNSTTRVTIDEKTIQDTQAKDVFSLISTQANISFFSQNLQAPQIFLRGGDSSHLLIVVDGIPTYDASTNQRTFNLNNLNIKNIRKIEILKGGQTVLYGGQALSGVILIETKSSVIVDKTQTNLEVGLGTPEEKRLGVQSLIPLGSNFQISPSARYIDKKTQSPIKNSPERYKAITENFDIGLNYKLNEYNQVFFKTFYFKDVSDSPTTANINGRQGLVDVEGLQRIDELFGNALFFKNTSSSLQPRLLLNYQSTLRSFYQGLDIVNTSGVHESQRAHVFITRLDFTPYKNNFFALESGLSYTKEQFTSLNHTPTDTKRTGTSEMRAVFVKANYTPIENFKLDLGIRLNSADSLKTQNNLHAGLVFFEDTRLEWSTGYRTPSLGQRYGRFQSPDLEAETSQTYSITQDLNFSENFFISLTAFETQFNNLIVLGGMSPNLVYLNIAKTRTRGLELASTFNSDAHTIQLTYGYQEPWDVSKADRLFRRPLVTGSARHFYRIDHWNFMLEGTGTGERFDEVFGRRQKLSGYFLLNSAIGYKWSETVRSGLRVNNIFNYKPQLSTEYYGQGIDSLATLEISI